MLESINAPSDLRDLDDAQLEQLAVEIREFLVAKVARTGGHLGPNLGVVELTLALHRVFDSPRDALFWDTGHQAYVHKLLTGRRDGFDTCARRVGCPATPAARRASTTGPRIPRQHIAVLRRRSGQGLGSARQLDSRHVVAVIGDGALTGGMAWEALNNIAGSDRPMVVVVNDNERSYDPTIGAWPTTCDPAHDRGIREVPGVGTARPRPDTCGRTPGFRNAAGWKKGVKDMVAPQGMFETSG